MGRVVTGGLLLFFVTTPGPDRGLALPSVDWAPEVFPRRVKQPGREANH
jgi:hypothetical protein